MLSADYGIVRELCELVVASIHGEVCRAGVEDIREDIPRTESRNFSLIATLLAQPFENGAVGVRNLVVAAHAGIDESTERIRCREVQMVSHLPG